MNSIARATLDERRMLFSNVSAKIGLSPAIVEKDVRFPLDAELLVVGC